MNGEEITARRDMRLIPRRAENVELKLAVGASIPEWEVDRIKLSLHAFLPWNQGKVAYFKVASWPEKLSLWKNQKCFH